jgi:hypothetical protein
MPGSRILTNTAKMERKPRIMFLGKEKYMDNSRTSGDSRKIVRVRFLISEEATNRIDINLIINKT